MNCACGGSYVPCRIGIVKDGILEGDVCYKLWCPDCGNSYLTSDGSVMYYNIIGNIFNFDPHKFWCPAGVPLNAKDEFIRCVLSLADRFKGKQDFTIEQVRNAYRGK